MNGYTFHRLLWLHTLQIVSVCFEVGPTAATTDLSCRYSSKTKQTTQVSQRRHFGGPHFHIVEFAKTLAYNIKIQSKFIYRTDSFYITVSLIWCYLTVKLYFISGRSSHMRSGGSTDAHGGIMSRPRGGVHCGWYQCCQPHVVDISIINHTWLISVLSTTCGW